SPAVALALHDALPIWNWPGGAGGHGLWRIPHLHESGGRLRRALAVVHWASVVRFADASVLPVRPSIAAPDATAFAPCRAHGNPRSDEDTSELQSRVDI